MTDADEFAARNRDVLAVGEPLRCRACRKNVRDAAAPRFENVVVQ